MSNAEIALELRQINRQSHKLAKALAQAEQAKPKTVKKVNYPKACFMLNLVIGLAFILTNAAAKFAFLAK